MSEPDRPKFKFGQKIYDCTQFFSGRTNPDNQVRRIFANPIHNFIFYDNCYFYKFIKKGKRLACFASII